MAKETIWSMEYNGKFRLYESPLGMSENFDEVVPDVVSLSPNLGGLVKPWGIIHDTVFDSVKLVPYKEPTDVSVFLDSLHPQNMSIDFIYQVFLNSIEEHWSPDKLHIIGCSSGYDSRLIAKAIQDLTKKNGTEWLGDYLFVENGGEGDGFKAIMQALNFDNYLVWEPKYNLNYFRKISERFNGVCSFPVNQWYDYFADNYDLDSIQYITGYGANVTDAARKNLSFIKEEGIKENVVDKLRDFFKWQYYLQIPAFRQVPDTMYPFWNFNYIRASAGSKYYRYRLSQVLVEEMVPECRHIPRMGTKEVYNKGYRTLDAGMLHQLSGWYLSTDFGKNNPVPVNPTIEYTNWWLYFQVASYLEARDVIDTGQKVRFMAVDQVEITRPDQRIILPEKMKDVTIVGIDCGGSHACGLSAGMRRYANVTSVWRNKNKHGLDHLDPRSWFGWDNIPKEGDELIIVSAITYNSLVRDLGGRKVAKLFSGYKTKKFILGDGRIMREPDHWNKILEDFDEVFCHICKIHFRGDLPTKIFFQPFDMSQIPIYKNDMLTVAHSPFGPIKRKEKGTDIIEGAMRDYPNVEFDLITGVPWEEAMRRKGAAHIFVDQVAHYDIDKLKFLDDNYEWPALGKSGLEAMHLGCLVITRGQPEERGIPSPPVAWCTTDNFRDVLRYYITHHESREKLAKKQQAWAREYATHDFAARNVLGL